MAKSFIFIVFTVLGVWLSVMLAGCADTQPLTQRFERVTLQVRVGNAHVKALCRSGQIACATKNPVLLDGVYHAAIAIPRPQGWHDWPAMCVAGHELWEVLSPERHGDDVRLPL